MSVYILECSVENSWVAQGVLSPFVLLSFFSRDNNMIIKNIKDDDHHIQPRRHSRLWGEGRREKRKNAAAAAGTPTPLGAFCFCCGTVREFGATVAGTCGTAPGGRIKWGGIYLA